jgi:hypothetical protein
VLAEGLEWFRREHGSVLDVTVFPTPAIEKEQMSGAKLREMPTTAEAYKRYLTKFDRQTQQIERLQRVIRTLRQREYEARTAYEAYLRNLRVE